eukprot:6481819-Amphidinium_carterae.1
MAHCLAIRGQEQANLAAKLAAFKVSRDKAAATSSQVLNMSQLGCEGTSNKNQDRKPLLRTSFMIWSGVPMFTGSGRGVLSQHLLRGCCCTQQRLARQQPQIPLCARLPVFNRLRLR